MNAPQTETAAVDIGRTGSVVDAMTDKLIVDRACWVDGTYLSEGDWVNIGSDYIREAPPGTFRPPTDGELWHRYRGAEPRRLLRAAGLAPAPSSSGTAWPRVTLDEFLRR